MAFHCVPIDTPMIVPANDVNDDMKFIISALFMDNPDVIRTAKSPEREVRVNDELNTGADAQHPFYYAKPKAILYLW